MTADVKVEIWSRSLLREADIAAMERLYREFYVGADEADFRRDLAEKDYAILLRGTGVCGFSTMKLVEVAGMRVLFSGDTVVETSQRGQWGLAGGFGHMIKFVEGMFPDVAAYWFLISKGARTYRFLPTFFRRYVPGPVADADLSARLARVASASDVEGSTMEAVPFQLSTKGGGSVATETIEGGVERPQSGSYRVRVDLDNDDGLMTVGMTAKCKIKAAPQTLLQRFLRLCRDVFNFKL